MYSRHGFTFCLRDNNISDGDYCIMRPSSFWSLSWSVSSGNGISCVATGAYLFFYPYCGSDGDRYFHPRFMTRRFAPRLSGVPSPGESNNAIKFVANVIFGEVKTSTMVSCGVSDQFAVFSNAFSALEERYIFFLGGAPSSSCGRFLGAGCDLLVKFHCYMSEGQVLFNYMSIGEVLSSRRRARDWWVNLRLTSFVSSSSGEDKRPETWRTVWRRSCSDICSRHIRIVYFTALSIPPRWTNDPVPLLDCDEAHPPFLWRRSAARRGHHRHSRTENRGKSNRVTQFPPSFPISTHLPPLIGSSPRVCKDRWHFSSAWDSRRILSPEEVRQSTTDVGVRTRFSISAHFQSSGTALATRRREG